MLMTNILSDGTVIASTLALMSSGGYGNIGSQSNLCLRLGEVRSVIYPDDEVRSKTKQYLEYEVDVAHHDGASAVSHVLYHNCLLLNDFGGIADRSRHTLRADPKDPAKDKKPHGTGAKVLLLCVNGQSNNAYIIGGIREDSEVDNAEDGHNLFWEFNGIRATVNKNGELQVKFRGATKVDGQLADSADPAAGGSTATFTKEGGIALETAGGQSIFLDHQNKKLSIVADTEWNVTVNGSLVFNTQQDMTLNSSLGGCSIAVLKTVNIQSAGVHVGLATDQWMKGTTYRVAETTLHSTMLSQLAAIAGLVSTAAATLQAASVLHKIPVVGPIIGSAPLQAAATALNSAGPLFASISGAIGAFESGTATYLSIKNLTD